MTSKLLMPSNLIIAFLILPLSLPAFGRDWPLFSEPGQFVSSYNRDLKGISLSDTIVCSGGKRFLVTGQPRQGSFTIIFPVENHQALRLPIKQNTVYQRTLDDFVDGYEALHQAGVPVPKLLGSRKGEFALVEYLGDSPFNLEDFVKGVPELSAEVRTEIWEKFLAFAVKTAAFSAIGDFKLEQVIYTEGSGFVLVDWQSYHESAAHLDSETVFDRTELRGHAPADIRQRMRAAITEARRSMGKVAAPPLWPGCKALLARLFGML